MKHITLLALLLTACADRTLPSSRLVPESPVPAGAVLALTDGATLCSAVAVAEHRALTAAHCMNGNPYMRLILEDGTKARVSGLRMTGKDTALLYTSAYLRARAQAGRGPAAWSAGFGCRSSGWRTRLQVREFPNRACRGDSGGGVFNYRGQLVGIIVSRSRLSTQFTRIL